MKACGHPIRRVLLTGIFVSVMWVTSAAQGARLPDGTIVSVRQTGIIASDSAKVGDPVAFVVTRDVVVGGGVAIARGTVVAGVVVTAQRAQTGFTSHRGKLAFAFKHTTTRDGQLVTLRSTPSRGPKDRVVIDRSGRHTPLQWVGPGDTFEAFVDGDYEFDATVTTSAQRKTP